MSIIMKVSYMKSNNRAIFECQTIHDLAHL